MTATFDARERKLARTMQGGKEPLTEDFLRRARTTIAWCEAAGLTVTDQSPTR